MGSSVAMKAPPAKGAKPGSHAAKPAATPVSPLPSGTALRLAWSGALGVQRACGGGGCGGGDEALRLLQTRREGGGVGPAVAPRAVHDTLRAPGSPLDAGTRAFFEPRFGRDLGGVRVHQDPGAAASARSVGAHAYTVGQHVVFASGRYAPHTDGGRRLLAHELAHTVQQGSGGPARSVLRVEDPGTAAEAEADAAANAIMAASPSPGLRPAPPAIQRTLAGPAVQRSVGKVCEPPGFWLGLPQAAAFGIIAEKLIENDYVGKMGVIPHATVTFDNAFAGPIDPEYAAFIVAHNPGLPSWAVVFLAAVSVRRPDILADSGPLKEYDEIKPNSLPSIADGWAKMVEIPAYMTRLGLPYRRGSAFTPTASIPFYATMLPGGIPFRLSLNVWRLAPGLILYELCIETDWAKLALAAVVAALIAAIIALLLMLAPELAPVLIPVLEGALEGAPALIPETAPELIPVLGGAAGAAAAATSGAGGGAPGGSGGAAGGGGTGVA
jgi:Domain of unknown function (DUF4157)